MFLPILLSLGLLGASATSVGNGNCPTDAELLKSFSAPSKTLDLNWLAQMKEKCAKGNCEEVSKEIWDISRERETIIENAYKSLSCRFDTYTDYDCYKYNMPISQADEIIPGLGESLVTREANAINKIRPYRNELLYRVGWYKDPEFEGCNDNALLETPVEKPEDTANYGAGVSDDEGLDEDIAAADVSDDYDWDDWNDVDAPVEYIAVADVSYDVDAPVEYIAVADVSYDYDWDDWNDVDAPVEDTAPIVDEAPTEFLTIKVTPPTGIASYDNYLAGEGVLLVEGTTPVAEEAPESPVEEPTTIEAQYEAEEETEKQVNKPASKSRWKFWQRYAA